MKFKFRKFVMSKNGVVYVCNENFLPEWIFCRFFSPMNEGMAEVKTMVLKAMRCFTHCDVSTMLHCCSQLSTIPQLRFT